jgi:hypothetical protein
VPYQYGDKSFRPGSKTRAHDPFHVGMQGFEVLVRHHAPDLRERDKLHPIKSLKPAVAFFFFILKLESVSSLNGLKHNRIFSCQNQIGTIYIEKTERSGINNY